MTPGTPRQSGCVDVHEDAVDAGATPAPVTIDEWPSLEELENLSNSIGTCNADLTIADVMAAMEEVGRRQRENAAEAQAKADEAYLRAWTARRDESRLAQLTTDRDVLRRKTLIHYRMPWHRHVPRRAWVARVDDSLAEDIGEDTAIAVVTNDLKEAIAAHPEWCRRYLRKSARRVRMARKRRRGW